MSYIFRLKFAGLCAMLTEDDALTVMLVNTEHGRAGKLNYTPEPHFPRAYFDLENVQGTAGTSGRVWWDLNFEDLSIKIGGEAYPLTFEGKSHTLGGNPPTGKSTAADRQDFAWIPDIKEVCPDLGSLESDCLAKSPAVDEYSGFVKARMRIDTGTAKALELSSYAGEEVLVDFLPKPANSQWPGRASLPHYAGVEIEVPEGEMVELIATRFGGSKSRSVVLGQENVNDRVVEVEIKNLCCGYGENEPNQVPSEDIDFQCFYMLFENYEDLLAKYTRLPIPVPVEFVSVGEAGSGGSSVKCTLTRFRV